MIADRLFSLSFAAFLFFGMMAATAYGLKVVEKLRLNPAPPQLTTIPQEVLVSVPDGILMPAGSKEYFAIGDGKIVCIKADQDAHIRFITRKQHERLLSEPGVSFCKPVTLLDRLWWAVKEAWR